MHIIGRVTAWAQESGNDVGVEAVGSELDYWIWQEEQQSWYDTAPQLPIQVHAHSSRPCIVIRLETVAGQAGSWYLPLVFLLEQLPDLLYVPVVATGLVPQTAGKFAHDCNRWRLADSEVFLNEARQVGVLRLVTGNRSEGCVTHCHYELLAVIRCREIDLEFHPLSLAAIHLDAKIVEEQLRSRAVHEVWTTRPSPCSLQ